MTASRWPMVALGEVLRPNQNWIEIEPDTAYQQVTVKLWGKGVVQRAVVEGSDIAASTQVRIKAGQFIASRIDARHGAFGLVPDCLDGAVVSGDFPCFDVDEDRLIAGYLHWISRTDEFVALARAGSEGSTNRVRLKERRFLLQEIPLPPLEEQRRIVAQLDEAAERIARRAAAAQAMEAELAATLRAAFRAAAGDRRARFGDLMRLRPTDTVVQPTTSYAFAGVYSFARGVFRSVVKQGAETSYERLTKLRTGDFVYPKLMAWEGAFGLVPESCDGCFVTPEFPVFEVDEDAVAPELIELHFRDSANWPKSTGTNMRRKRIKPDLFLALEMPLPPRDAQRALAAACARANAALAAQRAATTELDQLLPAMLHEMFGVRTDAAPLAAE
ncbi:restriction endonuclease subunit S [Rubrimonas cliftonensis]|uniref:Type I restriction enzyme, S subunit n=1 Tax=Rubrimonas cliftonensis TaxID=89524 RepID=A0A1H4FYC2_9RHOB|nr:restriction endonuclease subunit S [Rubrimonas cliftonensis]SEB02315.1 type I restriction enzyme, S subunit [Rubrimonas cliftonensis]